MTFIFYCYTSFHTEVACVIFLVLLRVFVTFRTEPDQLCPRVFNLCALLTCRTRIIFKRQSREPYLLISLRENKCGVRMWDKRFLWSSVVKNLGQGSSACWHWTINPLSWGWMDFTLTSALCVRCIQIIFLKHILALHVFFVCFFCLLLPFSFGLDLHLDDVFFFLHLNPDLKRNTANLLINLFIFPQSSSHAGGDQELVSRMKSLELENQALHKGVCFVFLSCCLLVLHTHSY